MSITDEIKRLEADHHKAQKVNSCGVILTAVARLSAGVREAMSEKSTEASGAPAGSADQPRNAARNARLNWNRKTDREVGQLSPLRLLSSSLTGN